MTIPINVKHNHWTCISDRPTGSRRQWFRCDCGREARLRYDHVKSGRSRSCGKCGRSHQGLQHGATGTQLHRTWLKVRDVAAWSTFEAFRDWSLQHGFQDGRWLIRLDATKPHGPINSRWLDKSQNRIGRASG